MTRKRPSVRWLRRAVILAIVLMAAYSLPALWPDVRTAVAGVAAIAPAVLLAGHAAEWAPRDVGTPFSLQVRASTG